VFLRQVIRVRWFLFVLNARVGVYRQVVVVFYMFWISWKAASISSSIFLFFSLAPSRSSETHQTC